ncbi:MAG: response regulator [Ignavibacteriae bacterium]|nr:response regulator [Ignavibacteriota bacterium]
MTITEQILNLLELNENIPALVLNHNADVVAKNDVWSKFFGKAEAGKSFYTVFDKNTSLLVKSSLIDVKTFLKVKTREIRFLISNEIKNYQLIISPFKIQNNLYFYLLVYNESHKNNFIVYPTLDDFSYTKKYEYIFNLLSSSKTEEQVLEVLKDHIDIAKEPIALKEKSDLILMNLSFKAFMMPEETKSIVPLNHRIKTSELLLLLYSLEKEIFGSQNFYIIENTFSKSKNYAESNKILVFPFIRNEKTLIIGKINLDSDQEETPKSEVLSTEISQIKSVNPTIIYDANNFEILDANNESAKIYGYNLDEFKSKNLIELFPPEEMQKLLSPILTQINIEYTQLKKDGSRIKVKVQRESAVWKSRNAMIETIQMINENDNMNVDEQIPNEIKQVIDKNEIIEIAETEEHIALDEVKEFDNSILEISENDNVQNNEEILEEENIEDEPIDEQTFEEIDTEEKLVEDIFEEKKSDILEVANNESEDTGPEVKVEAIIPENKSNLLEEKKVRKEISPFLSLLFHELLTPVNVILGFVQEIIDSIENLTEEQEESAKIIKENQLLLLSTMNSAVQYAKLEENLIPIKIEDFDFKNHLIDIQDNLFKVSEKESIKAEFSKTFEQLSLKNDKQKLLVAINYFIKFAVNLTDTKEIFISLTSESDNLIISAKDKVSGISDNFLKNILEILNVQKNYEKNNLGISSIDVKLSQKLNEIVHAKVISKTIGNENVAAFVVPVNYENFAKGDIAETITSNIPVIKNVDVEIKEEIITDLNEENVDNAVEVVETINEEIIVENEPSEIATDVILDENSEVKLEDTNVTLDDAVIEEESHEIISDQINADDQGPETAQDLEETIIEDFSEEDNLGKEIEVYDESASLNKFDISSISCLFIDDSIDSQLLLQSQLYDLKKLSLASNLIEALPLLEKFTFDLIIVDVNLNHKFNGFDALKIIRQFNDYKNTPIVALTAYPFENDRERFLKFGFSDYFIKPLLRDKLMQFIERIFS